MYPAFLPSSSSTTPPSCVSANLCLCPANRKGHTSEPTHIVYNATITNTCDSIVNVVWQRDKNGEIPSDNDISTDMHHHRVLQCFVGSVV